MRDLPEVGFDLTLANRITDILDEGYDISVVIAPELPDSGFVSAHRPDLQHPLRLAGLHCRARLPKLPAELSAHRCLRLVNSVMSLDRWLFDGPDGQELACINQTHFQVNTADAMTEAVVSGMGIGALPVYAAVNGLKDGSLVRVLPRYSLFHLNVHALYPSRQYLDAKIRTWVEFLREHMPAMLAAERSLAESGGLAN